MQWKWKAWLHTPQATVHSSLVAEAWLAWHSMPVECGVSDLYCRRPLPTLYTFKHVHIRLEHYSITNSLICGYKCYMKFLHVLTQIHDVITANCTVVHNDIWSRGHFSNHINLKAWKNSPQDHSATAFHCQRWVGRKEGRGHDNAKYFSLVCAHLFHFKPLLVPHSGCRIHFHSLSHPRLSTVVSSNYGYR